MSTEANVGILKKRGQRKTQDPCPGCFLHKARCICHLIPELNLKTKLSLVIHARELKRTTNTGRLALMALKNSEIFVRGAKGESLDLSKLKDENYQPLLFFPSDDAHELTPDFVKSFKKPIHLIVPDGNWRQASKVAKRHPELSEIPRVKISTANPSVYHLRKETTLEGMATIQAIAYALRSIEGEDVFEKLHGLYEAKLEQTLLARGQKI